ncbi:polyprenyl synthetase family protein [Bryobacter aggregatus]|uniref:polyprenyl synthetase family protein n=1 Tax=Bryobacter aggregatus TaxID=360054 RepID=UPI0004E0E6A5|nr:polyprenyl synthetase family protein [Bryobacter aggregatus]
MTKGLTQAVSMKQILDLVRDDLKRVEAAIGLETVGSVSAIKTISHHMHSAGGKRLRPILVLLSSRLVKSSSQTTDEAIQLAAVVELIHTSTLVHDDVIDEAKTRRGAPSANALWGNQMSVLAGDWLYMQAFQIAMRQRNFAILDLLIGLTQVMVEGEFLQMERLGKIDISETDYMELVDRKTASLFSACCRLGAMAGNASEEDCARLGDFAWNLGMAFQMIDDILDFTSKETILGKPVGNDLAEGKVTLPLLYALTETTREETRSIETILKDRSYERVPFSRVLEIIEKYRGVERAQERAVQFTGRARQIIETFPDSAYRKAVLTIADIVTDRDR